MLVKIIVFCIIICVFIWAFKKPVIKIVWKFLHRKHIKKNEYCSKCFKCKEVKKPKQKLNDEKGGE